LRDPYAGVALSFTYPAALAFLAAVPFILWLHLRRRQARQVVVPSVIPWLVLRAARPPGRRRPPRSLLLALQVAAATAFALALAGPTWPSPAAEAGNRVVILDATTSMTAAGVWPAALARAGALLEATRGEASLVTLAPRPRALVVRAAGSAAARLALARLVPGGTGAATDEALALAAAVAPGAEIVVVSDGRVPAPGPGAPAARWELVGAPADNVAVVTAAARRLAGETRLFARLANFGRAAVHVPLALVLDRREWDRRVVELAPGATHEAVWSLPAGARQAEVRLTSADALAADDVASVPLDDRPVRVQWVGESSAVGRALAADPALVVTHPGLGTYRGDGSVDVTVFVGAVPDPLPAGGVVIVHPSAGGPLGVRPTGGAVVVDAVGDDPLVAGLDLTGTTLADVAELAPAPWLAPVPGAGDHALAYVGARPEGAVVVLPFNPDGGDVARRLAFPILVSRAVALATGARIEPVVPAGVAEPLPGTTSWMVTDPAGARRTATGHFDDTALPGLYQVERPAGIEARSTFAVVSGDLTESNLRAPVARSAPGPRSAGQPGRVPLWPWLAGAGLVCAVAEGLVRAGRRPADRAGAV
jgi:hypothetical protein